MHERPPPPPPPAPPPARQTLVAGLEALDTSEVLALCQRFSRQKERLGLYLEVLRRRTGTRAQLAAALVSFDLARQGGSAAQREFFALAPTLRALSSDTRTVNALLQEDPYLARLWRDCSAALSQADPRESTSALEQQPGPVAELDLLSDEDLGEEWEELVISEEEAEGATRARRESSRESLRKGVEAHLKAALQSGGPFSTETAEDLERLERLLFRAASHAAVLPEAAGLASLGHLYLAMHLRQHTVFGQPNPRRQAALRTGLSAMPMQPEAIQSAELFNLGGAPVMAGLGKVAELLLDYLRFCAGSRLDPRAAGTLERYVEADRTPEPVLAPRGVRRRPGVRGGG